MCARSKSIIPELLTSKNRLEDEVASYKKKEDIMEKEKRSNERKIKKLETQIALYEKKIKMQKVCLALFGCLIVIVMMKMSG